MGVSPVISKVRIVMSVTAVFNQKGGVGKTTTCLNLAAALSLEERQPIALDMDPQAHLSLACQIRDMALGTGMAAFFKDRTPLQQLLRVTPAGWRLVPASLELSKVDALYGGDAKAATLLRQGVHSGLAGQGDPILIDCCPMLGVLTLNALLAADRVLIPVSADYLSLEGVARLESAIEVLEKKLGRNYRRRIVVTRFDPRRKLSYEIDHKLRELYGERVCATRICENVALAASPMHGQDVFAYAAHSSGAADYKALAGELLKSGFFDDHPCQ